MTLPAALQTMLAAGRLRERPTTAEAVAALWHKAVDSARDAALPELSIDGALRSAYDAGHLAALALLGAYGVRPAGGHGHHEMAFAGAAATGHAGLADLVADSEEVRNLRAASAYDPVIATPGDRDRALRWMHATLPVIRVALVSTNPHLDKLLISYQP